MIAWVCAVSVVCTGSAAAASETPGSTQPTVIVVAGAVGDEEFAGDFEQQLKSWADTSGAAQAKHTMVGMGATETSSDRERLREVLAAEPKEGRNELWVVFVGHGTFDGREAKFNLRGPDVTATDVAEWLRPFRRPLAVIDTASASAPFLAKLSSPERVVVTSTRSGYQQNYARFGKFFAEALPDPRSDLNKDGQISLLEAFLSASHRTADFYKTEGRLATEHALIDDNGDGLGTPADWFKGVRATKSARDGAALDGARAHQFHLVRSPAELQLSAEVRARRDQLEMQVEKLRAEKGKLPEAEYLRELEKILLELAALYEGT